MVKSRRPAGSQSSDERAPAPSSGVGSGLGRVGKRSPSHFLAGTQANARAGPTPRYLPVSTALNADLRAAQGVAVGAAAGLFVWLLAFALWAWLA